MFQYIKISFLFCFLSLFLLHRCIRDMNTADTEPVLVTIPSKTSTFKINKDAFEECSEITRKVLITFCGSCHQSSLETHKPAAIAIFDLDKGKNWHATLIHDHIEGIENRIENKSPSTQEELDAIEVFLELKASQLKP